MSSVLARACVPARVGPSSVSEQRVSARVSSVASTRCDLRWSRRTVVGRATSGDGEDGSSPRERSAAASSLDALDKLFSSMDETEASASAGPARADDPFASLDDDDEGASTRRTSSSSASSSSSSSFEGTRRAREGRTELDDFLDVGMRFEGGKTLIKALTGGSALGTDLGAVRVGQLAVVSIDKPSLELWESQAYEVRRAYYQRRGDELGSEPRGRARAGRRPARARERRRR